MKRLRQIGLVIIGIIVGAAVGLFVIGPLAAAPSGPVPVTVLGDSITTMSEPSISTDLFPAASMTSYAHVGWTEAQMGGYEADALASHPFAVIVNLGTNDALQNKPGAVAELSTIASAITAAGVPCVAFVTVTQLPDLQPGNTVGGDLDSYIATLPSAHPGWRVIDWWAYSSANAKTALSSYDGIHPASAGQQWLGEQYAATVNACTA